ncbi:Na+/H+ antiporter NhaA [Aeromicrobium massiliense]|uniref:Na+/H+ antiporter NhaA n=1 Tax=Aeromicrobium massiliense TaxID=1464554 RepID=UPI0002F2003D|nr:Na+/H+ antiporter NhaA [Aeromicrobium massiliense]
MARTPQIFSPGTWPEARRIADVLRTETVGGFLLIGAGLLGLVCANVLGDAYESLRDTVVGPHALHLDLTLGTWAADGLLAVFFFVAGLELKREFVAGDLRDPGRAVLPVVAAVGGMVVPALVFVALNWGGATEGWAIPTATDIAFALAVLAVVGSHLPTALRTFLLTLAVVDDLLAICVIAVFYTSELHLQWLALALVPLAIYGVLVQRRVHNLWLLLPLGALTWALVHASGVHATVAGVLLAFTVPVLRRDGGDGPGMAEHLEHLARPFSSGFAVPVFAFFAAGVAVGSPSDALDALSTPVALGVMLGLLVGKTIGITLTTWLLATFTRAKLGDGLAWIDVVGLAMLGGIGFTVSLLIGELAYGPGTLLGEEAKLGVLAGTLLSVIGATLLLRVRDKHYARIAAEEARDDDADGIPDVYQRGDD